MEQAVINKNKLFFWSVVIAILNPVFSGLILGLVMLTEAELKREGRIVFAFSVAWGAITLALLAKFQHLFVPFFAP